jgi:hypothetical protein
MPLCARTNHVAPPPCSLQATVSSLDLLTVNYVVWPPWLLSYWSNDICPLTPTFSSLGKTYFVTLFSLYVQIITIITPSYV